MTAAVLLLTRPLPVVLADLRAALIADGVTAESPGKLGDEGEQIAREERWT